MLSSLFAAITCLTFPVAEPLESPAVMPQATKLVSVGTHVTPTSFRCRNFSSNSHVLVFAAQGVSEPSLVALPAGGSVEYQFSPAALAGVSLEVVEMRDGALVSGGAQPLVLPTGASDMNLWSVPGVTGLVTWEQLGCEVRFRAASNSLLPLGSTSYDPGTTESMVVPPTSVPRVVVGPSTPEEGYSPM